MSDTKQGRSLADELRIKSRKGEATQAELKSRGEEEHIKPSLDRARSFLEDKLLPRAQQAAEIGKWQFQESIERPKDLSFNAEVLVREIQSQLHARGLRADVMFTLEEHITFHVSWLPPLRLTLRLFEMENGKQGAIFGADLRAVVRGEGKNAQIESLWVKRDIEVSKTLEPHQRSYKVLVSRIEEKFVVKFFGRVEVKVSDEPDEREYFPVSKWIMEPGCDASICLADLRKISKQIEVLQEDPKNRK